MIEEVKVISPTLQCVCVVCGDSSDPFQQSGEIEVERSSIPFGVLDEIEWSRSDGTPLERDKVNRVPSICPGCQVLGRTLEEFGLREDEEEN